MNCDECKERVDKCDWCKNQFHVGDTVFCLENIDGSENYKHFDSHDCMVAYFKDTYDVVETTVTV